jgi:acyl-CoA synthetase (AMP-forming)/AMP-acid ligase II
MAPYKAPRLVEFVTSLPKSGSGKILWRKLQEEDAARGSSGGQESVMPVAALSACSFDPP